MDTNPTKVSYHYNLVLVITSMSIETSTQIIFHNTDHNAVVGQTLKHMTKAYE